MKTLAGIASAVLLFALLGCSNSESSDAPDAGSEPEVANEREADAELGEEIERPPAITPWECLNDRACTIPLISAHRGLCGTAPENTIAAFLECQNAGVPMVELDTQETADGHVVVMHDGEVDRTTDGEQRFPGRTRVDELTLAEFKSLVISAPGCDEDPDADPDRCRPPTLREALDKTAHWMLYDLDFKAGDPARAAQVIKNAGATDRILFFDSNLNTLRGYRAEVPEGVVMPRAHDVPDFEALLAAEHGDLDLKWIHGDNHNIAEVAAVLDPADVRLYVNAFDDVDLWLVAAMIAEEVGDQETAETHYAKAWAALDEMLANGADCFGTDFAHGFVGHLYPRGFGR